MDKALYGVFLFFCLISSVPVSKACGTSNSPITNTLSPGQSLNIASPNYPSSYPNQKTCYWLVQTAPYHKLKYRTIGEFDVGYGCHFDNVTLYDSSTQSNMIGTYCTYSEPNPGITTGRYLYITFNSYGGARNRGFKLEITSKADECGTSDLPTTYVLGLGQHINITSPYYPNNYPINKTCYFLVQTVPHKTLKYRFVGQLELGSGRRCLNDSVKLYDSSKTSNVIGSFCGLSHYNPGFTTGRYLYGSFKSDGSSTNAGFKLEIIAKQYACGSYESPTIYSIEPGQNLTITSPNYPGPYQGNEICYWLVQTEPDTTLKYIFGGQFDIKYLHPQWVDNLYSYKCDSDMVTLYDSSNTSKFIGNYCGPTSPGGGTTTDRFLLVSFKSAVNSKYGGFTLKITSRDYECGTSDSPTTLGLGPGRTFNITSPNYPDNYPENEECFWLVQATPENTLKYRFLGRFQLEEVNQENSCESGSVKLHDSLNLIGSYCGNFLPPPGTTTGRNLLVSFKSYYGTTYTGFKLEITSTDDECGSLNHPIKYVLGTGDTVDITSPNYPLNYRNLQTCHWLVEAAPPHSKLNYRFVGQFSIERGSSYCDRDSVMLNDSSTTSNYIVRYCGTTNPAPGITTTTGRYLYVTFTSDAAISSAGFKLEIMPNDNECGSVYSPKTYILGTGQAINITSPNYPNNYRSLQTCHWLIKTASPYSRLNYRFIGQLGRENHHACVYDYVALYESSFTTNRIGGYCGSTNPYPSRTYTTTGSNLYVIFKSDAATTFSGFKLEITPAVDESDTRISVQIAN